MHSDEYYVPFTQMHCTCAEIVEPGEFPPAEILVIKQLKLMEEKQQR